MDDQAGGCGLRVQKGSVVNAIRTDLTKKDVKSTAATNTSNPGYKWKWIRWKLWRKKEKVWAGEERTTYTLRHGASSRRCNGYAMAMQSTNGVLQCDICPLEHQKFCNPKQRYSESGKAMLLLGGISLIQTDDFVTSPLNLWLYMSQRTGRMRRISRQDPV